MRLAPAAATLENVSMLLLLTSLLLVAAMVAGVLGPLAAPARED